jgi:hypothetical protein
MSIASMTEVAFQRRVDVGRPDFAPRTLPEVAGAATGKQEPETPVNTALRTMVTYVPTEVITLYLAVVAALHPSTGGVGSTSPLVFWLFLVGTPLVVWVVYAAKVKNAGRLLPGSPNTWPIWEMSAGTMAFAAWGLALPQQPFPGYPVALGGVVVLVTSTVLGLLAPLFSRPLQVKAP